MKDNRFKGKKVHFIGSEGVSMKILKTLLENNGAITTGSDLTKNGHNSQNVQGVDAVVYTAAIHGDNPELKTAIEKNLEVIPRAKLLGEVAGWYNKSIAVAGTHGKTTTTAMLWEILNYQNPTVHIGGNYEGKFGQSGGEEIFITEACEFNKSFLELKPTVGIILNMDLDHTDCYSNIEEVHSAFAAFASKCQQVIVCADNMSPDCLCDFRASVVDICRLNKLPCPQITAIGTENCDYYARCLSADKKGCYSFCVHKKSGGRDFRLGRITLSTPGRHNVYNALAAICTAFSMDVSFGLISAGLYRFRGIERRMELLGYLGGSAVFSDYAHHPREIETGIRSARECGYKHLTVIFEPHTYTRTKSFMNDFANILCMADSVVLLPVYGARENLIEGATSDILCGEVIKLGGNARYLEDYKSTREYLKDNLYDDGVLLFMGAGTINNLAASMLKGAE